MTQPNSRRPAGAMTIAMSAHRPKDLARVLRVGVIQDNAILEERVIRERATVSVGTTERATIPVHADGFPAHREVFVVRNGQWALRVERGTEGRVALDQGVRSIEECVRDGAAVKDGDGWVIPLTESARGKVSFAGVTVLFQFVQPPPEAPRPQLPSSLKNSLSTSVDWRYNASLSCFLAMAVGALGWVEYGYDPVVDDLSDTAALVARSVRMDPTAVETPEPAPSPTEAAAAQNNPAPTSDSSRPQTHRPSQNHANNAPHTPSPGSVQNAQNAADRAIAAAMRAMDASWAPITSATTGPNSAVDQLANHALLDSSLEDLRRVNGISSRAPSTLARPTLTAQNGPNAGPLGRSNVVQTGPGPGDGPLREPTGPRSPLITRTEEPETDTCEGDAGAVARAIRGNLSGMRSCYERATRMNPSLEGRVTLRFTVGQSGRATTVNVSGMDEINECISSVVRRAVFPVPACGAADYVYPIVFSHGGH